MYAIDYYKTKRKKPTIKEPDYSSDNKKVNYMMKRRYLHRKDLIDKCWNIKSLTIDIEDIEHIILDKKYTKLFGLYAKINRTNNDDNKQTITILNNNSINLSIIYEIINCRWMVNANEEINELDILIASRQLIKLVEQYEKETNNSTRKEIRYKINLLKYYIDTVISKYSNKHNKTRTL